VVVPIVGLVFALAWIFRWTTLGDLGGDDHWSLWTAATFLKGDRPFREFSDPGDPLYWGASALAQLIVGYRVIGEVLLGVSLATLGLVLGFRMSWLASRSLPIALALTTIAAILMATGKLYSYPKIFVYPLGLWLAWRYIDRPSLMRTVMLAVGVAVAWGYRHDHGAYVAVGASAAVVAAHWRNGPGEVLLSLGRIGIASIAVLSPYFALIQAHEGVLPYFQERIRFAAQLDEEGRRAVPFVIKDAAGPWLGIPAQTPAAVEIRWDPAMTPEERGELERRYSLAPRERPYDRRAEEEGSMPYSLLDGGPANVSALIADARILDTGGLDRDAGRVNDDSWLAAQRRTYPWLRVTLFPALLHQENAGVWIYYVSYGLPFAVLATLFVDRLRARAAPAGVVDERKMFVAAVLMAVANLALLRKMGYFADHFDVAMVMAAWLLGRAFVGRWRTAAAATAGTAAVVLLGVTTLSAVAYSDLPRVVQRAGLNQPPARLWQANVDRVKALSVSPPIDGYAPADSTGDKGLIRYLYDCTRADDRIWITTDAYAVPYYTERRVVGHIWWANGFMSSPASQRQTIDLLEREQVPIILGLNGDSGLEHLAQYDLLREYVAKRYTREIKVLQDNGSGRAIWLLIDGRRVPSGTNERLGLPCFK
jgi:hypothetical protein